jgi:WhiB family redox-sensing transcriptional regulator
MSPRTGSANAPSETLADDRIPFPRSESRTSCQAAPALFAHRYGDSGPDAHLRIEQARALCAVCPIAKHCLKWALANPSMVPTGIWAGTTARQRTALRQRLVDRLGPDWVAVVAEAGRDRRERAAVARHTPLTIREAELVRVDRELNGPMPRPCRPLTPVQQQRNRSRLVAGLK